MDTKAWHKNAGPFSYFEASRRLYAGRWESMRTVALTGILAAILAASPIVSVAGTTGELTGTVTDLVHRPVAGAVIVVTSPAQVARTVSDAAGRFSFVSLSPGTYTVTVSHAGYIPVAYPGIALSADYQSRLVAVLPPRLRLVAHIDGFMSAYSLGYGQYPMDVYRLTRYSTPFYDFGDQGANPLRFVPGVQLGSGLVLAN